MDDQLEQLETATKELPPGNALVVFSGGQDSTTCLGLALHRAKEVGGTVYAVCFDYGQKHSVEMVQAHKICNDLGVELSVVDVPALRETKSALTTGGDVSQPHEYMEGVPASFVPARNATFLAMAWGMAMDCNCKYIYTGVCQTDYSGYPDCREVFIGSFTRAMQLGYESDIRILTPLTHLTKSSTFELARRVGILNTVLQDSHTCYNGSREKVFEWGFGCGECPACELRAKGHAEYMEQYRG